MTALSQIEAVIVFACTHLYDVTAADAEHAALLARITELEAYRARTLSDQEALIGRWEALEDEAHNMFPKPLTDHERGYWLGQQLTAKSIRREFADRFGIAHSTPADGEADLRRKLDVAREALDAIDAIIDSGVERDIKWTGMTARDIARAALTTIGEPNAPA